MRGVSFQLSVAAVLGICTLGAELVAWRQRWLPLQAWPLDRPIWLAWLHLARGRARIGEQTLTAGDAAYTTAVAAEARALDRARSLHLEIPAGETAEVLLFDLA